MAGNLARADQTQLSKIYCHKRDINVSRRNVCSVYHVLRKCTRGDRAVYLHRDGPGAMGHRRCLKSYDRASQWYSEKKRGTVPGYETIFYESLERLIGISHKYWNRGKINGGQKRHHPFRHPE